MGIGTITFID